MKLLVCGGRDFSDYARVRAVLGNFGGYVELAHGGARGADALARRFAQEQGWPVKVYRADWSGYGKSAGVRRNQQMLDEFRPDFVVAFPGGRGTADMVRRARNAGVAVTVIEPTPPAKGAA